ncbi:hypothetical protein EJF36_16395 [Bacillus sp. HMF5848]|uniref:lipopolysaccharide biosynthesis protein n=1 Tax=Bacillus sp. HMF5848 TaxID=2495421 RepID=UPI000F781758|nr:oligosaccharide flippase family protein [Bacillus sp. HMF5848]RSK28314.1 hypothetical protein EJF36_16395 [Bacillus sp. HMF5848]
MTSVWNMINKYMEKSTFLRHVATLTTGTASGQIIIIAASPLLTRIYSPEDFGLLGIYVSLLAILVRLSSLQYDKTITLPKDTLDASALTLLSFVILVISTLIVGIIIFFIGEKLSLLFDILSFSQYLFLLPVSLLGIGTYEIMSKWAMRKEQYSSIAKTKVTQSFIMVSSQVMGGLLFVGPISLLVGDALGRMTGSSRLFVNSVKQDLSLFKKVTLPHIMTLATRYKKFPLLSSISALTRQISTELPTLLLIFFYGPAVGGSYVLVQRILSVPLNLIGTSIDNVMLAETSHLLHSNPNKIKKLVFKTMKNMFYIISPIMIVIALSAPSAFPFIFGEKWADTGIYVSILSLMYFFQFISVPFSPILIVLERQGLQVIRELIRILLISGSLWYANLKDIDAMGAIILISVAGALSFISYSVFSWFALHQFKLKLKLK